MTAEIGIGETSAETESDRDTPIVIGRGTGMVAESEIGIGIGQDAQEEEPSIMTIDGAEADFLLDQQGDETMMQWIATGPHRDVRDLQLLSQSRLRPVVQSEEVA